MIHRYARNAVAPAKAGAQFHGRKLGSGPGLRSGQALRRGDELCLALLLLVLTGLTYAQTGSAGSAASTGPSLAPLIALFLLVLALIPAAVWLLKRMNPAQATASTGLRVVAQLSLGPRERVVVLEAGERWLLLGVTASSIQRIGTLPKGEEDDLPAQASAFAAILKRMKP